MYLYLMYFRPRTFLPLSLSYLGDFWAILVKIRHVFSDPASVDPFFFFFFKSFFIYKSKAD